MKWLIRGALTLVTLIVVAVVVLLLIPAERVAGLAAQRFEAATGRELVIAGPVKATLWPRLGVRAEGVTVANAEWSGAGPMLTAEALEVGIAPASLFGGEIGIETLRVDGARLVLERRADGSGNWEFAGPAPAGDGGNAPVRDISIDRAVLRNGEILFIDHGTDVHTHLRAVDLETALQSRDAPIRVVASALVNGQALSLEAEADALRPLLDGDLTPVRLVATAGDTSLRLDGRADLEPVSFEGRIDARSGDGLVLARAFGIAPPDLPRGLGADSVALAAAVTLAPEGSLHLRDMVVDLDANRITGAADIAPGAERPRITANLAAERLDLTAFAAGGGNDSMSGWSRDPIDVSGLFAVDGAVTFASGPIALSGTNLDALDARATLEAGRAVVTLRPLVAYGGTLVGDIVVNGRGGLSARADLDLSGLAMQPLLTEVAGFDRLVGQADASVNLLGVGNSVQALMSSLEGSMSLRAGQGEILGLDIPGMIRNLDPSYRGEGRSTVFESLEAAFAVSDGVATGETFRLIAPFLTATGEGRIDLGARTISYRLLPTLRREADGNGVTVPILIEGPWALPRIRPDLEYLARQRVAAEREELEARARSEAEEAASRAEDALRRRLAEELKVAPEALTDRRAVEDAVRERVTDQLLDLLGNR
ncbi:putative assembly protein [Jannaschia seosinensis]|uniref:Putative assembly protein n=1 Tax=Jannaschia seosinensis TaxID=313367 RepID=A0A0M7BAD7_9RHOB|nr:AsmA family protein [Jannaschia seosinensis]CUH39757.1 putative assembly protein [Jannaschia seosinensis]